MEDFICVHWAFCTDSFTHLCGSEKETLTHRHSAWKWTYFHITRIRAWADADSRLCSISCRRISYPKKTKKIKIISRREPCKESLTLGSKHSQTEHQWQCVSCFLPVDAHGANFEMKITLMVATAYWPSLLRWRRRRSVRFHWSWSTGVHRSSPVVTSK